MFDEHCNVHSPDGGFSGGITGSTSEVSSSRPLSQDSGQSPHGCCVSTGGNCSSKRRNGLCHRMRVLFQQKWATFRCSEIAKGHGQGQKVTVEKTVTIAAIGCEVMSLRMPDDLELSGFFCRGTETRRLDRILGRVGICPGLSERGEQEQQSKCNLLHGVPGFCLRESTGH
jgi:hypothetical protein